MPRRLRATSLLVVVALATLGQPAMADSRMGAVSEISVRSAA